LPEFDRDRLLVTWQEAVFALSLAEDKIEPEAVENMRSWPGHRGLWQASAPRAPPDVDGLVLDLDAAYSDSSLVSPDQADESQELTDVDIDTFLASF